MKKEGQTCTRRCLGVVLLLYCRKVTIFQKFLINWIKFKLNKILIYNLTSSSAKRLAIARRLNLTYNSELRMSCLDNLWKIDYHATVPLSWLPLDILLKKQGSPGESTHVPLRVVVRLLLLLQLQRHLEELLSAGVELALWTLDSWLAVAVILFFIFIWFHWLAVLFGFDFVKAREKVSNK